MSTQAPARIEPEPRNAYKAFRSIGTRWMDNDAYGHVNNVVYYSWFDTAVNAYLIEHGVLDIHHGEAIGLVVETQCNYFRRWPFRKLLKPGCGWRDWAAPACVTKWLCLPKTKTCAQLAGILCTCMWTA